MEILIIGAGGMAKRHIKALNEIGGIKVSCFDISSKAIKKLQYEFPEVVATDNFEDLTHQKYNGCIIAAPTHKHIDYMEWCLDKKLPFLVEKPIYTHTDGVSSLVRRAKEINVFTGVAFPRRHSAGIRRLSEKLNSGYIGELKTLRTEFSQDFRKYRPDYDKTYYAKISTGGGVLMDALSHHIDLACFFAGTINKVACIYDKLVFENVEVEDTASMLLKFKNGIIGTITGNQFQKPNTDFIELTGTKGSMRYDRLSGLLTTNLSDKTGWDEEFIDGNWDLIVRNQAQAFLSSINENNNLSNITTLNEGLHGLSVVLSARSSQKTSQIADVPMQE